MHNDAQFQRALLLHQQGRYQLAEKELRGHLVEDPHDGMAHSLLALTLIELEQRDEAEEAARSAIAHEPESGYSHYALSRVLLDRHRLDEAVVAIEEALRLDPTHPDFYAILAAVEFDRRNWAASLEAAEEGLKFDAEDVACNNLRAMALVKLGRKADAGATIDSTLAREPENAISHANMGWTLLEQGDREQAMYHFRESLRLDPTGEWARAGLVEALKAGNPLYAIMLKYFLWMGKLSQRAGWSVIIVGYIGYRFLADFARDNPEWAPYVMPLIILYVAFALLTWLAQPLFNLVLLLHPVGKHALDRDQKVQAGLVGSTLGVGLLFTVLHFATSTPADTLWFAIAFGLLSIPTSAIHNCDEGWPRTAMGALTGGLAITGVGSLVVLELMRPPQESALQVLGNLGLLMFIFGILVSQFVANWLMGKTATR